MSETASAQPSTPGAASASPTTAASAADAQPAQSLEDRYGTGRRRSIDRRFAWIAAALLVLAGIGFLLFSGWQSTNRVSWQDIGFTRDSDFALDVKFEVTAPPSTPVACAVEALNTSKATVGWKVVELPVTAEPTHTIVTRLITTNPATAASVRDCWVIEK
ncbi:DUF4307 domain-containing protein [Leucobacter sp. VD1]|uniref:DUF4307 domain-containing protein n=1 Tax=Leucobacter sp. VD1 TaxID=3080381 RepID=UPI0030190AAB